MGTEDRYALPVPHFPEAPEFTRRKALLLGSVVFLLGLMGMASEPVAILLLAGVAAVLLVPWAGEVSLLYFAITAGTCGIADRTPRNIGLFNVYSIDFILVIFAWTFLYMWIERVNGVPLVRRPAQERRLIVIWAVWSVLGLFYVAYGYSILHLPFDRVLGDFRRATVYSMAFFVPLFFPYAERHLKAIGSALILGGVLMSVAGIQRMVTGTAARVEENFETGHLAVRLMGIAETMTLAGLLAMLTVSMRVIRSVVLRVAAVVLMAVAALLLILSGFRLAMAFVLVVPAAVLVLQSWARRESLRKFVGAAVVLSAVVLPAIAALPVLFPEQFDKMLLDLQLRLVNDNVQGGFRWWTYEQALHKFTESPIIGQGFGYYLMVPTRNQAGMFDYVEMNNPHNMFLAVLYQTGLLGFIPFAAFHILFAVYAFRSLRTVQVRYRPTYIALLVNYLCYFAFMNLQPYFSAPFVLLAFIMGFIVRLARPDRNGEAAEDAGASPSPASP